MGKFWRALGWKIFMYFMAVWNILQTFWIFYGHLDILCSFCTFFSGFGIMHQEKSGNPGLFD
jgi:hypothetical protein